MHCSNGGVGVVLTIFHYYRFLAKGRVLVILSVEFGDYIPII